MIKHKHKTVGLRTGIAVTVLAIVAVSCQILISGQPEQAQAAYPYGCVTQECRDAADRANNSDARAKEAAANARTLEGEVARLNSEIAALEDEIAMNQAIARDLSAQIDENNAKLTLQQAALAKLLVDIHFETEPDPITMLASSNSLGDFAEKQSRQSTAKTQITASAEAIKTLKEELEKQKISVDALIANTESTRNQVTQKRNEQAALITKYQNDSTGFEQEAAAARETMQREIAAEIARYNSGGVVGEGYNSYPYRDICPNYTYTAIAYGDGAYGGYKCQCTSYAGWKAYEFWGVLISSWGNAYSWGGANGVSRSARGRDGAMHAYRVNSTPAAHTVAVSTLGAWGHVMWVESVNANGTINISEYNNTASAASGREGDFGARYNVNPNQYLYIHFDQPLY